MPIISPWMVWVIETSNYIKYLAFLGGIIFLVFWFMCLTNDDSAYKFKIKKHRLAVIGSILLLSAAVIPTTDTGYKMMLAKRITPKNIVYMHKIVKQDFIDFIKILKERN